MTIFLTSVLTTATGLAFVGDVDRYFRALDFGTGEAFVPACWFLVLTRLRVGMTGCAR